MLKRPHRTMGYRIKLLAIAIAVMIIGFYVGKWMSEPNLSQLSITHYEPAISIPAFTLDSTKNRAFNNSRFSHQWTVLYVAEEAENTDALTLMGKIYNRLTGHPNFKKQTEFVYVNAYPKSLDAIASSIHYYNTEFVGATGDADELQKLATILPADNQIVLIDPSGDIVASFDLNHAAQSVVDDFVLIKKYRIWKSDF